MWHRKVQCGLLLAQNAHTRFPPDQPYSAANVLETRTPMFLSSDFEQNACYNIGLPALNTQTYLSLVLNTDRSSDLSLAKAVASSATFTIG